MNSRDKVIMLFQEVIKGSYDINQNPLRAQIPEWDSLKHLELTFLIEEEFSIRFSSAELAEINSLNDLIDLVEAKQ